MRLVVDMNLTPRWVHFLQDAGYQAVHWSSVGPNSAKDSEICDYARRCVHVILTNDLDFPSDSRAHEARYSQCCAPP
jgi:predicted nuclease of predicted toxin-antitoxin system